VRRAALPLLLPVVLVLAACASPEATRARAQGRGADVGNVGPVIKMHEGSDPYWRTRRLAGIGGPPLEPARQAAQLSR
jgi:hypothetical protein